MGRRFDFAQRKWDEWESATPKILRYNALNLRSLSLSKGIFYKALIPVPELVEGGDRNSQDLAVLS